LEIFFSITHLQLMLKTDTNTMYCTRVLVIFSLRWMKSYRREKKKLSPSIKTGKVRNNTGGKREKETWSAVTKSETSYLKSIIA